MSNDRPKSTGRKAFERRWRLAQAEAKRPKAGCALVLACVAGVIFAAGVVATADFFMQPTPTAPPTTLPRSLP